MLYKPPILFPLRTPLKCDQCRQREAVAYDPCEFYIYCQQCLDLPRDKGPLMLSAPVYFKRSKHQLA